LLLLLFLSTLALMGNENNTTQTKDQNKTTQAQRLAKELEAQMKREEKYAKEQRFYQGEEYNLSAVEINPELVESVPLIEPDYDFEIDDVYRDDI